MMRSRSNSPAALACLTVFVMVLAAFPQEGARAGNVRPKALLSPAATTGLNVQVPVSFVLENIQPVTVVNLVGSVLITYVPNSSPVYNQPWTLSNVPLNSEVTLQMIQEWKPTQAGEYDVFITFNAANDIDPTNNGKHFTVLVIPFVTPANTSANHVESGKGVDPVDLSNGEYTRAESPDLYLPGPIPLAFSRSYFAGLKSDNNISSALGENWLHNYDWKMTSSPTDVTVVTNQGRVLSFTKSGQAWSLNNSLDIPYQLAELSVDFLLLDPTNRRIYHFSFDKLTRIEDGKGNVLLLTYNGNGVASVSDGIGRTITLSYDGSGNLSSVTDGSRTVLFSHAGGLLSSVTDARGNVTTYSYAPGALLTAVTQPEGNTMYTRAYDASKRVSQQTDANNNAYSVTYPASAGGETTVTDPLGNAFKQIHATGMLVQHTDANGGVIGMRYNARGQRDTIRDRLGNETVFAYHPESGYVQSIKNAAGSVTTFDYAKRSYMGLDWYDLEKITMADGKTLRFTYDANGNILTAADQRGMLDRYTYNLRGQVVTHTNKAGAVTTYSYTPEGMVASIADNAANTTSYEYDAVERLVKIVDADASERTFTYDACNNLLTDVDATGNATTRAYDKNNRLISKTNAANRTDTYLFDAMNRIAGVKDEFGNTLAVAYDAAGRLASFTDRTGHTTTMRYDKRGRLSSVDDAGGKSWLRSSNPENVPLSRTDPLGNASTFTSSNVGWITSHTSPASDQTQFAYDALGRITAITDPLNHLTRFTRDERGLLTGISLPGDTVAIGVLRDDLGQVTRITDPRGKEWSMQYDSMGRSTQFTDPLGDHTRYAYDSRNRISRIVFPGNLGTMDATYDAAGRLLRRQYSDGVDIHYAYDNLGKLVTANGLALSYDLGGEISNSNGMAIERDKEARVTGITFASGKKVQYVYDSRGRLTEIADWIGGKTTYQYDDAGRVTSVTTPNGITTAYQYDKSGRVTGMQIPPLAGIQLTRDALGNITSATRSVPRDAGAKKGAVQFTYDNASRIATDTYDGNGNVLNDPLRTYSWQLAGRLMSYTGAGTKVDFEYDGYGMRTSRSEAGVTRTYVWNYTTVFPTISVIREGGADKTYAVTTPSGLLLYTISAADNGRTFYHFDEMGNTVFTTNDAGAKTADFAYSPYGELLSSSGAADIPFTFQGQFGTMREGGTNLYYSRARYYDAAAGRFLSRDPLRQLTPRDINPYQYAKENPLQFSDPSGTSSHREAPLLKSDDFSDNTDTYAFIGGCREATGIMTDDGLTATPEPKRSVSGSTWRYYGTPWPPSTSANNGEACISSGLTVTGTTKINPQLQPPGFILCAPPLGSGLNGINIVVTPSTPGAQSGLFTVPFLAAPKDASPAPRDRIFLMYNYFNTPNLNPIPPPGQSNVLWGDYFYNNPGYMPTQSFTGTPSQFFSCERDPVETVLNEFIAQGNAYDHGHIDAFVNFLLNGNVPTEYSGAAIDLFVHRLISGQNN